MRRSSSGRRLGRAAIVLAAAVATVAGLHVSAFSDPRTTKDAPPPTAEDASIPAPDGDSYPPTDTSSVPSSSDAPPGVSCPTAWRWFDNPVMHYGLCVPPTWGFTDLASPAPLQQIPTRTLEALHLVSGGAFPWRAGTFPFDAVRDRGIVDVELNILEPGLTASEECEPTQPLLVRGTTLLTCEQAYDRLGLPASTGLVRATKIIVPLLQAPEQTFDGVDTTGARLLVIARTSARTPLEEVEGLWRLVDSIRPY